MRPEIIDINNGKEFGQWYWLKKELVQICKDFGIPYSGSKFELRDRIIAFLDEGEVSKVVAGKKTSTFDWANETLTLDTVITDSVSFGPNFRGFMKENIGKKFSCHSEFMLWVKSNTGKTLLDAIDHWYKIAENRDQEGYKTKIADHNMYNQYLRDFMTDNPNAKLMDAKLCWEKRKLQKIEDGFLRYKATDTLLLRNG